MFAVSDRYLKFPTCLLDFMPLATLRGYTQDNNRKFFMTNEGVNYDVHDFPSSELGLKLGGYMMLSSTETFLMNTATVMWMWI